MPQAIRAVHDTDPKQQLLDKLKGSELPRMMGARVLVATYIAPEKTRGGLYIPDKTRDEGAHQGKVGLVVGMGNLAFQDDGAHSWGDARPAIGDWVMFNIGDTRRMVLGKTECRWMEDVHVAGILSEPDIVW